MGLLSAPVFTGRLDTARVYGRPKWHPYPRVVLAKALSCSAFCQHGPYTRVLGTRVVRRCRCTPVIAATDRVHRCLAHITRVNGPCSRIVWTGAREYVCEHGCLKWHPCLIPVFTRPVNTGSVYGPLSSVEMARGARSAAQHRAATASKNLVKTGLNMSNCILQNLCGTVKRVPVE